MKREKRMNSKAVVEIEYKFFNKYVDALLNVDFFFESVEVEGNNPPETFESKKWPGFYRLKYFDRNMDGVTYARPCYLKI